ncbi:MAG: methyltransferase [Bacteroidetes bacterium]|nr:methyltransferase [Bacteroidota bacterium]
MTEYTFKNIDNEGENTLQTIALANHLNEWMYATIKPHCKGKVMEIGSGIGNISEFFLNDNIPILLSDIRESYCKALRGKFEGFKPLLGIEMMNLTDSDFDLKFSKYFNSFDTVFALNVVEHIYDEQLAIANCYKLLKPGGHLIILVPAYQWLFNSFDSELFHYRRYTRRRLEKVFTSNQFQVKHSQYFNAAGIAGWLVSGKIQHHKIIPKGQIRLFNNLVFFFRLFDKLIMNTFGLSVITVGVK